MCSSCWTCSSFSSKEKQINTQLYIWLPEWVSINSYKWLLTEQDAFCWHVSQCHQFNSLWVLSSPSRLLSTHTSAQTKTRANKHTHVWQMHTPMYTHRSARITVREVSTSWLPEQSAHMCQQFPFTWGQRRGEEEKKKMMGKIPIVYLYGTSSQREREQKKKTLLFPSVL